MIKTEFTGNVICDNGEISNASIDSQGAINISSSSKIIGTEDELASLSTGIGQNMSIGGCDISSSNLQGNIKCNSSGSISKSSISSNKSVDLSGTTMSDSTVFDSIIEGPKSITNNSNIYNSKIEGQAVVTNSSVTGDSIVRSSVSINNVSISDTIVPFSISNVTCNGARPLTSSNKEEYCSEK